MAAPDQPKIQLALSGGGFRATLFHLGVIRYLHEQGRLGDVEQITSVSGGSILAAHLVTRWADYSDAKDNTTFAKAAAEVIHFVQRDVRGNVVRGWIVSWFLAFTIWWLPTNFLVYFAYIGFIPSYWGYMAALTWFFGVGWVVLRIKHQWSLIYLLQRQYEKHLGLSGSINTMPAKPRLFLFATSMTTGEIFAFHRGGVSWEGEVQSEKNGHVDKTQGIIHLPTSLPTIGYAVAASSAFPALFSPVKLDRTAVGPSIAGKELAVPHYLGDGGIFDNLGVYGRDVFRKAMENIDGLSSLPTETPSNTGNRAIVVAPPVEFILSDAGAGFDWQLEQQFALLPARATRATDILMNRLADVDVKTTPPKHHIRLQQRVQLKECWTDDLQGVARTTRTDLDKFSSEEIHLLVFQGYCAAKLQLTSQPEALPEEQAVPRNFPGDLWQPATIKPAALNSNSHSFRSSRINRVTVRDWLCLALFVIPLGLSFPVLVHVPQQKFRTMLGLGPPEVFVRVKGFIKDGEGKPAKNTIYQIAVPGRDNEALSEVADDGTFDQKIQPCRNFTIFFWSGNDELACAHFGGEKDMLLPAINPDFFKNQTKEDKLLTLNFFLHSIYTASKTLLTDTEKNLLKKLSSKSTLTSLDQIYVNDKKDDKEKFLSTIDFLKNPNPTYGSVNLRAGFPEDPYVKKLYAGGEINTGLGGVNAWIAKMPDFILTYSANMYPLTIYAESDAEITLLINLPDGNWIAKGATGNQNPLLRFDRPQSGRYDIWVGTREYGKLPPARVCVTERK